MPFLINLIIGVILTVASTLLQQAFAKPQEQRQARTGTRGSALFGGKVPQYFLVGTVGEAGKREYRNAWGSAGGVPNAYNVDVYSFGDLPITALSRLFVNGLLEPISGTGHVDQGYPSTGDKAGNFWVEFFDGSQTTASAYLMSKFGADADRPWTSDMIGRGVPYLTATALWSEGLWTGFPEILGEFQGIPLYDPRQDDTAGGEGDQRWDDPSTWSFSDNNIVIVYNIERGIHYDGAKVWGGSSAAAQLPYDVWAAAMDACDELVALDGGGTEKRFRAGRRISLNERPADVIKELLIAANARISHAADGTVYVLVGVPDEADGTFTDADVLASEPLGSIPFPNLDEVINGATATYREPAQAWEDKETAPYLRSDLVDEDDGRQQVEGLDLGTTFSGTQAQRILKAVIEEGRRFRRHVVALPPEYAQYRPLSVLAWTSERFDYEEKLFLVTARTRDPWGKVVLGLQEIDPADHDWDPETDEQPLSFAPVVTNRPPPQPMTGWAVSPYIITDNGGIERRPAILVEFEGGLSDVRAVRVQVRLDGEIVFDGETPYDPTELTPSRVLSGNWCLPNEEFEVSGIYVPFSGRETEWSAWLTVTTPDVPEVLPGSINIGHLSQDLLNAHGVVTGDGVESISASLDDIERRIAEQAAAALTDQTTNRVKTELLRVQTARAVAAVITEQVARIEGDTANAGALTEVIASLGTGFANALFKIDATVAGDESEASILFKVRTVIEDAFSEAALRLIAEPDGVGGTISSIQMMADRLVFISTAGAVISAPFSIEGGVVKLEVARAGTITSADGTSMIIDFDNKIIHME